MNGTGSLRLEGAVVFWSASRTSRDSLDDTLSGLGLSEYMPGERTDESALVWAIKHTLKRHRSEGTTFNVIPRKDRRSDGFEVQQVTHGKVNRYRNLLSVSLDYIGKPRVFAGLDHDPANSLDLVDFEGYVQYHFKEAKAYVEGSAVGQMLVKLMLREFNGLTLKDTGGVYWVPNEALAKLVALRGQLLNTVALDILENKPTVEAAAAFRRALTKEVESEVERLSGDIMEGDLGERALKGRSDRAAELITRVAAYEEILGETLQSLKDLASIPKQAAATALVMLESDNQFESVFTM